MTTATLIYVGLLLMNFVGIVGAVVPVLPGPSLILGASVIAASRSSNSALPAMPFQNVSADVAMMSASGFVSHTEITASRIALRV